MPIEIRLATPADRPRIAELRTEVGWAVRAWALDAIAPPIGAAWVALDAGTIVGCGSGIVYGRLGIVGTMIVAESHRRRGIGAMILGAVLDFLRPRADTIELNATPSGRPLYERFGFEPVIGYLAANLPPSLGANSDGLVITTATDAAVLAAWDARRFGGNRLRILAAAVIDPERHVLRARASGDLIGYAVVRPAETSIGPFVADSVDAAQALLAAAGERAPSVDAWRITLPGDNAVTTAWLHERGIQAEPHGTQMRLGQPPQRAVDTIWGVGAGAVG